MQKPGELRAKFEIAELVTRYATLNDTGEWDSVAQPYMEHGRMSRPTAPDDFIVGRAAILSAFRARRAERRGTWLPTCS